MSVPPLAAPGSATGSPLGAPDAQVGPEGTPTRYFTRARLAFMLSSIGQESTTAVLAPFFAGTLGAAPIVIAGVEAAGRAGGTAARFGGSSVATRRPGTRGLLDVVGHSGAAVASAFLAGSSAVWQAGACRAGSWTARGLGTPVDMRQVSEAAVSGRTGRRLGIERCFGALGAAAGPLAAILLLAFFKVRTVILLAAIPGVAAGLVSAIGAARSRRNGVAVAVEARPRRISLVQLREHGPLGRLFLGVALYESANIAAALLLLRATKILPDGAGPLSRLQAVAMLYVVYQLSAAACAAWAGMIVDRLGPGTVVAGGAVSLLVAYAGFAYASQGQLALMAGCFVLAGAASGAVDAAEYTGVAKLAAPELRWAAISTLAGLQNTGRVLATVTAGGLWTLVGPKAGLLICGPMLVAATVLFAIHPDRPAAQPH